jgi:hypothetical protein
MECDRGDFQQPRDEVEAEVEETNSVLAAALVRAIETGRESVSLAPIVL